MEKTILDKVCKQVYKQFPIVKDQTPVISQQGTERYLLIFSTTGKTPDGKTIEQKIRVVATEAGEIIKTTMSR